SRAPPSSPSRSPSRAAPSTGCSRPSSTWISSRRALAPGSIAPGSLLSTPAGAVLTRFDERRLTLPVLERLRAETRETVHLTLRRGFQAVFIERLQGERAHALAISLGGVLPLHVGAAPRTLLAFEPDSFWD